MKHPIKYVGLKHIDWVGLALQTNLPSISKMLIMYLGRFMNNEQDVAWPSQSRICGELSLSNGALNKHLKLLEDEGWITREAGNSKKTTRYYITFPKKIESALMEANQTLHLVEGNTPPGGDRVLHEVETNNNNNNKKNNKYSEEDFKTAEYLYSYILDINPRHKKPDLGKWANEIRLIRERDGKTIKEIRQLIEWVNKNEFWRDVILSPSNLRKNWDKITVQKNRHTPKVNTYTDGAI